MESSKSFLFYNVRGFYGGALRGRGEHSTFEGGTDYCALSNTVSRFREGSTAAESLFSAGFNGGSPPNPNLPIYQPVTEAK